MIWEPNGLHVDDPVFIISFIIFIPYCICIEYIAGIIRVREYYRRLVRNSRERVSAGNDFI